MRRAVMLAGLLGVLAVRPLSAQETASPPTVRTAAPDGRLAYAADAPPAEDLPWRPVWGTLGLRAIPAGPKTAPNGEEYHPNFSIDLDLNFWLWPSQGLYLYGDMRVWGEKGEFGVTNSRDGAVGTSKRQFDLTGGAAWNYVGPWEFRAFGYTLNNLNRGHDLLTPVGFNDGFGMENRYYLSSEYARLGQSGFDVSRADFVSVGYFPSKTLVGNDGRTFQPGLLLRAYLTCDLWDWPGYLFGDATYISEDSLQPKLLLFDLGVAARPFHRCPQCEFRIGAENTADFTVHAVQNLWYVSARYLF